MFSYSLLQSEWPNLTQRWIIGHFKYNCRSSGSRVLLNLFRFVLQLICKSNATDFFYLLIDLKPYFMKACLHKDCSVLSPARLFCQQQHHFSTSQAGCCQVDVWSLWALTRCVTCRASGASPNPDDSEASSRLTGTADKTRRLQNPVSLLDCRRVSLSSFLPNQRKFASK